MLQTDLAFFCQQHDAQYRHKQHVNNITASKRYWGVYKSMSVTNAGLGMLVEKCF